MMKNKRRARNKENILRLENNRLKREKRELE